MANHATIRLKAHYFRLIFREMVTCRSLECDHLQPSFGRICRKLTGMMFFSTEHSGPSKSCCCLLFLLLLILQSDELSFVINTPEKIRHMLLVHDCGQLCSSFR